MAPLKVKFKRKVNYLSHCFPMLVGVVITFPSHADEMDTLQFLASESRTYDNNLFKRSTNEVSDQITRTTIGVRLDKSYSLQRFKVDLRFIDNKYNESDYLDFQAKNYSASWLWALSPNLTGTIASERTQSLNSFTDFRASLQKNVRTMTNNIVNLQYSPHDVWALILGVSEYNVANSAPFTAITDFDSVAADYGLKYQFPSGSNLKLLAHNRRGEYKNRPLNPLLSFDNGYDENEYELNFSLTEQNHHNLFVKLGHVSRDYDNFTVRNYDSYIANVSYDIRLTGKLKTAVNYSRSISPFETSNTTYSLSDSFAGRLIYDISSKIKTGVNLSYAERDFGGRAVFNTSGRSDKEFSFDTYISWDPLQNLGFKLNRVQSSRNSTISAFDYDDVLTTISVELKI